MKNRPSWDERFMMEAILAATRHTCLKRGVGAILVKDKHTLTSGYNGAASGITSCRDLGYCYYEELALQESKHNGKSFDEIRENFKVYCQAVHAEANAFSRCSMRETEGSTLYVTNFPCPKCTQDFIITGKVKAVCVWKHYLSNPTLTIDEKRASERKLLEAGVSVRYIKLTPERISEIANYMAYNVGERTDYKFKGGE